MALKSERDFIEKIKSMSSTLPPEVIKGIGDDAAVLDAKKLSQIVISTDSLTEGVDFRWEWMSADDIGAKAVLSALSDLAAMNAKPIGTLISLGMHSETPSNIATEIMRGATQVCKEYSAPLIGGDISRTEFGFWINVTVIGNSEKPIYRHQAQENQIVAVSAPLGASHAGLEVLRKKLDKNKWQDLVIKHIKPKPRIDLVDCVPAPTAMIDLSDGLFIDLQRLALSSGVDIHLYADKIPIHTLAKSLAEEISADSLLWALTGGEDYELAACFTDGNIPSGWIQIGSTTSGTGNVKVFNNDQQEIILSQVGWDHFKKS